MRIILEEKFPIKRISVTVSASYADQ